MTSKTFIILAAILSFGASAQATTYTFDFNTAANSAGLAYDGNYAISPYMGTVNGGATVELYCDDFIDNINFGQQNISVYVTGLMAPITTLQDDTRYGDVNPNTTYAAGTQLYEEMAWLATQMQNTSGASAAANDIAIQEAIWTLTNGTGVVPKNSASDKGTAASGDGGTAQAYSQWITDATNDYNKTGISGYANLVTSDWYIITAVGSAGCTVGSKGSTGCTPGTAGTGHVTQEFLAYATSGIPTTTTDGPSTPEPASFFLIGSGLLAAFVGRLRIARTNS